MGHEAVPWAAIVHLYECEDTPCTGHPYCRECVQNLGQDGDNVVGEWRTVAHPNGLPDRLFSLKARVLRAKHRDGETEVVVAVEDLLALFKERDHFRGARKKYRWLYRRQRAHLRRMVEHFTQDEAEPTSPGGAKNPKATQ